MKVLIADDHTVVRKGLAQILREEFADVEITEVVNGKEAYSEAKNKWDIILMDISMPGRNGIDVLKQIRTDGIKTPILILSMHPEGQYAVRALKAGASGFLNKETASEELLIAVHKILSGKKYISSSVAEILSEIPVDKQAYDILSDREMQVFQYIALGKAVSYIAEEMSLSINTISTYRVRILAKLKLKNNSEITRYALEHHLI